MRLLHISDLHYWHITCNPFRLAGKRSLGVANLLLRRARKFWLETMPALQKFRVQGRCVPAARFPDFGFLGGSRTTT